MVSSIEGFYEQADSGFDISERGGVAGQFSIPSKPLYASLPQESDPCSLKSRIA
jgi:hypothetical protein